MLVDQLVAQGRGAAWRSRTFPAIGLFGPTGRGKRRLVQALMGEFGAQLLEHNGYTNAKDLAYALRYAGRSTWLYVDEAHALGTAAQELLCKIIDQGRCPVVLATDQPGRLREKLLLKLEVTATLRPCNRSELKQIAALMLSDLSIIMTGQGQDLIVKVSRRMPRLIEQYLRRLVRYVTARGEGYSRINVAQVRQFLRESGIDTLGLSVDERRYLRALGRAGKASAQSLSAKLGLDVPYLKAYLEGPLQGQGFVLIGPGGRELTPRGRQWFEKSVRRKDARRSAKVAARTQRGKRRGLVAPGVRAGRA